MLAVSHARFGDHPTDPPDTRGGAVPVTPQRVLPDSQHAPAGFSQSPIDQPIAPPVGRLFLPPERGVVGGGDVVLRTAMPEAAIDKHGHAELRKHKVRPAEHRPVSTPAGDPLLPKDRDQPQFRIPIPPRPNPRHYLGSLGWGEDVGHRWLFGKILNVMRQDLQRPLHDTSHMTCNWRSVVFQQSRTRWPDCASQFS